MDLLFFAYANSKNTPLPTLQEENDKVYNLLIERSIQQHYLIHRDTNATTTKVIEYLLLAKDFITLFSFSGHADRDRLFLEGKEAGIQGVAKLLAKCPNLKVVILNGCSTAGQVNFLLELGIPIVIATSAPVEDRSATQFAISFFQLMSKQNANIKEAFNAALAAAQTILSETIITTQNRGLISRSGETPIWGLFYLEEQQANLKWKLPSSAPIYYNDFKPNVFLIKRLIEALAPYNENVHAIKNKENQGLPQNILDKREAILKCLPFPISEQLRKLLVPAETSSSKEVFFDQPSIDRLFQLTRTYNTIIELITFVMLAQLWDSLLEHQAVKMSKDAMNQLKEFFNLEHRERRFYNFVPIVSTVESIFDNNKIEYFVSELNQIKDIFNSDSEFFEACLFMESLKRQLVNVEIESQEVNQVCKWAEEKLGLILGNLGFIAKYTLASVKGIDVLKYRHLKHPQYKHNVVKLVQRFVGLAEEYQIFEDFMDNSSVILLKTDHPNSNFLNLSPFIIDQNAFDERAPIAKLYFFQHYEKRTDVYHFKHIYKPDDIPLVVRMEYPYNIVKAQFEAFAHLIFNSPMNAL